MIGIAGPFGTGGVRAAAPRKTAGKTDFALPSEAASETARPAASAAAGGLEAMLLLQEASGEGAEDRGARRHGREILNALAALQRALLAAQGSEEALAELAALAEASPAEAHDPALRAAVAAVALRAKVELARHAIHSRVSPPAG